MRSCYLSVLPGRRTMDLIMYWERDVSTRFHSSYVRGCPPTGRGII